jgi:accessory colonization factor AcfC
MAIIDNNSILRVFDLNSKHQKDEFSNFKRTDVWNVLWATDNPDMFVSMEKIKMFIFRDTQQEVNLF